MTIPALLRLARLFACLASLLICEVGSLSAEEQVVKIGVIGLDTSHSPAFAKEFNSQKPDGDAPVCRVVAAYPHGSATIESSASRIPQFTAQFKTMGIDVVDSIDALLGRVDCVLLETNDGRLHLEQALQVFRAGKPVFIDKPLGSNLAEVIAIFEASKKYNVPMFSSSSLRYTSGAQAARAGEYGKVTGCAAYSPCSIEPTHVDLFWYGIHGVEILYTVMGVGCETVTHASAPGVEHVVGVWKDGRIGTFRGIRQGKQDYGATVFTDKQIESLGRYEGYRPLVLAIDEFFRSGVVPIDPQETTELYAFMQAAAKSKSLGGTPVAIADIISEAQVEANKLLAAAGG